MDILTKSERSKRMRSVRQRDTVPELTLRKALHARGYRYRLHPADLPGRPDIAFPRRRAAVFVHGCFWHGHDCKAGRPPATRKDYWEPKIAGNRERDARKAAALRALGWRVMTVWSCELKQLGATVERVSHFLDDHVDGDSSSSETPHSASSE